MFTSGASGSVVYPPHPPNARLRLLPLTQKRKETAEVEGSGVCGGEGGGGKSRQGGERSFKGNK